MSVFWRDPHTPRQVTFVAFIVPGPVEAERLVSALGSISAKPWGGWRPKRSAPQQSLLAEKPGMTKAVLADHEPNPMENVG